MDTVFVNWSGENKGAYSDANLRIFAEMTGLSMDPYDDCMRSNKYLAKVQADRDAAIANGVNSTPTLFLDGVNLGGLKDYSFYRLRIEEALSKAKVDG
jgi:predicted DsbA family dithiol-disulfide isomerase